FPATAATFRPSLAKSIRIISVEELRKLGEEMFDDPDRPVAATVPSVYGGTSWRHFSLRVRRRRRRLRLFSRRRQRLVVSAGERHRAIVGGRPAAEGSDRSKPLNTA